MKHSGLISSPSGRANERLIREVEMSRLRGKPLDPEAIGVLQSKLYELAEAEIAWEEASGEFFSSGQQNRAPEPSVLVDMIKLGKVDAVEAVDALTQHPEPRVLIELSRTAMITPEQRSNLMINVSHIAPDLVGPIQNAWAIQRGLNSQHN